MFYVISFGDNEFLHYSYQNKSNIVVITHCIYAAKRWQSKSGVYRVAHHLPKCFQDFVIIFEVDFKPFSRELQVVCRWNLSAFLTYEVQDVPLIDRRS